MSENLEIRPIEPGDVDALRRMFFRLSPETVYRRFFRPIREPSPKVLEYLTHVDHDRRDALVMVVDGEIVAVARYDRAEGTDDAEVAVVVEDAWQGRGIGRRLVARLSHLAQDRGVTAFTATMLGDNRAAAGLMRSVVQHPEVHIESGEMVMRAPLGRAA